MALTGSTGDIKVQSSSSIFFSRKSDIQLTIFSHFKVGSWGWTKQCEWACYSGSQSHLWREKSCWIKSPPPSTSFRRNKLMWLVATKQLTFRQWPLSSHFSHWDKVKGSPMAPAVKWNLSEREEGSMFLNWYHLKKALNKVQKGFQLRFWLMSKIICFKISPGCTK